MPHAVQHSFTDNDGTTTTNAHILWGDGDVHLELTRHFTIPFESHTVRRINLEMTPEQVRDLIGELNYALTQLTID